MLCICLISLFIKKKKKLNLKVVVKKRKKKISLGIIKYLDQEISLHTQIIHKIYFNSKKKNSDGNFGLTIFLRFGKIMRYAASLKPTTRSIERGSLASHTHTHTHTCLRISHVKDKVSPDTIIASFSAYTESPFSLTPPYSMFTSPFIKTVVSLV